MRVGRAITGFAAALVLALSNSVHAQPPPGPPPLAPGTGLIVGQVIDAATGNGVGGALVTLAGSRRVLTTPSGQFAFTQLPAGSHTLTAAKSGYIDGGFGMRRAGGPTLPVKLGDGEHRGDAIIRMWKHAAISGAVADEAGEPLVGIQVTALRRTNAGGRRRYTPGVVGTTDDRGIYRLARLVPGEYIVGIQSSQVSVPSATVRQYEESIGASIGGSMDMTRNNLMQNLMQIGATSLLSGGPDTRQVGDQVQSLSRNAPTPPPATGTRLFAYPSVYFPSAPTVGGATTITVSSGQERAAIDINVRPVPTARVSGTVAGAAGPSSGLPVRLVPVGAEDLGRAADAAGTLTDAGGNFTFAAVPAGDYTLRVLQTPRPTGPAIAPTTIQFGSGVVVSGFSGAPDPGAVSAEPTLWATVPVSIGESDVTGVNVVLRTGARVTGRVEFDGGAEKPTPEQMSRILVLVEPVDGQLDRIVTPPGRVDARGQFQSFGVAAGKYFVRVPSPPSGWTFRGAFLGERDIADSPIEIESADIADVVLSFTDRPASLSGTVQMTEQLAREGVAVIAFPSDPKAWIDTGSNPRRLRRVATTDAGEYDIASLPAGAYYVAAIRESAGGEWMDPKFLESLISGAAHVQIDHGEKATQAVKVQEVR
jgi:Carboxypeptidase regulatory-like domain